MPIIGLIWSLVTSRLGGWIVGRMCGLLDVVARRIVNSPQGWLTVHPTSSRVSVHAAAKVAVSVSSSRSKAGKRRGRREAGLKTVIA